MKVINTENISNFVFAKYLIIQVTLRCVNQFVIKYHCIDLYHQNIYRQCVAVDLFFIFTPFCLIV